MAVFYLSSANGNDGNDGTSKALAKATDGSLIGVMAAGDTARIDSAHFETFAAPHTQAWPGTDTNPNILISIDWTPDTYLRAPTAQFQTTGSNNDIVLTGSCKHYGMFYDHSDDFNVISADQQQIFEDCTIEGTAAQSSFQIGNANGGNYVELIDTILIDATGGDGIVISNVANFVWRNGPNNRSKYTNPGTSPAQLIGDSARAYNVELSGIDLADLTTNIFEATADAVHRGTIRNCLLNSGVALVGGFSNPNSIFRMVMCDDTTGNNLYRTETADFYGTTVTDDANFITTGGASDGTTPIAWKMVSNANAEEFLFPTKSYWISGWINSTGSKTFLIETNSENVTFQDDELWVEVEFLDVAADPQNRASQDRMTNIDSTPADQTDSAANPTWTTPGITTEKKQQLNVTATVNRVGPFRVRVCLAKPSATVWIDPFVTIS